MAHTKHGGPGGGDKTTSYSPTSYSPEVAAVVRDFDRGKWQPVEKALHGSNAIAGAVARCFSNSPRARREVVSYTRDKVTARAAAARLVPVEREARATIETLIAEAGRLLECLRRTHPDLDDDDERWDLVKFELMNLGPCVVSLVPPDPLPPGARTRWPRAPELAVAVHLLACFLNRTCACPGCDLSLANTAHLTGRESSRRVYCQSHHDAALEAADRRRVRRLLLAAGAVILPATART